MADKETKSAKVATPGELRAIILNGKNYSNWKTVMHAILQAKDLWDLCNRQSVLDPTDKVKFQKNAEAKAVIYSSLDANQLTATGSCETAFDLWVKIRENCEGAEQALRNNALAEFLSFKHKPGESIVAYCGRYEVALGRLLATGRAVEEDTKLWAFKRSLPKELRTSVNTWATANPKGDISGLISHLKLEFHEDSLNNAESDNVALFTSDFKGKPYNKQADKTPNNKGGQTCTYCKKPNHVWKECRKLKSDNQRKKKFANKKPRSNSDRNPSKERANVAIDFALNAEDEIIEDGKQSWTIDSGATKHMTPFKQWLTNFEWFEHPVKIYLGNGGPVEAYGYGSYRFTKDTQPGELDKVLWVPKLKLNLLSVSSAMEQGWTVLFNENTVHFRNKDDLRLHGNKYGKGLFHMLLKPNDEELDSSNDAALVSLSLNEWHQRFGHCGLNTIRDMWRKDTVKNLSVKPSTDYLQCTDCIMGKHCRVPHRSRRRKQATSKSAVLHMDTCGPMKTPSLGGNVYFVLATEEYSGYKLIIFTKNKFEIASNVKKMINKVELESKRSVKLIITDNGTEFVNQDLGKWLITKGINHEFSAPYTPEQNGLSERSNRTIIEGTRTLLLASKLPEELWAEAALTVVYTTNRTPSTTDPTKTKYELYFGYKPDVSNLRIFGQNVVVYIPKQKRATKWEPTGKIYRFVGYTDRHNTYRLYDQQEKSVIVSCDTKFLNPDVKIDAITQEEVDKRVSVPTFRKQKHVTFIEPHHGMEELPHYYSTIDESDEISESINHQQRSELQQTSGDISSLENNNQYSVVL